MVSISEFIAVPPSKPDFKTFQNLPVAVRFALVWGTQEQDAGKECGEREVAQFIIEHYHVHEFLPIGELIHSLELFIHDPSHRKAHGRMVRCYVDHDCNMVRAKLAWHEGY